MEIKLAQSVEHEILNLRVVGSSPTLGKVLGFPGGSSDKESTCHCRRCGFVPWVRNTPWRRKLKPAPVFLPGESHGQRILAGYSPWGRKDTTEQLSMHLLGLPSCSSMHLSYPGMLSRATSVKWDVGCMSSRSDIPCQRVPSY